MPNISSTDVAKLARIFDNVNLPYKHDSMDCELAFDIS